MRKGIAGVVVLAFALVFGGSALAITLAEVTVEGTLSFSIGSPNMELVDTDTEGMDPDWEVTITSGDFEGTLNEDAEGTLTYKGFEAADFSLHTDLASDLYDLAEDVLPERVGVEIATDYLTLLLNNTLVDDQVKYNFGGEISYAMDSTTLGLLVLNVGETDPAVTSYAVKIEAALEPITLTGEYGAQDESTAYFVEGVYAFDDASITGSYLMDFAEATTITAELAYPLTDIVDLTLGWTGETPAGGEQSSTIEAALEAALTDAVTGTLEVTSAAEVSYAATIELGF